MGVAGRQADTEAPPTRTGIPSSASPPASPGKSYLSHRRPGPGLFQRTEHDKGGAREGLFVISVPLGVTAVAGVRLINKLSLVTPWFLGSPGDPLLVYYLVLWK